MFNNQVNFHAWRNPALVFFVLCALILSAAAPLGAMPSVTHAEVVEDVCPNIDGEQTEMFPGFEHDETGNCVPAPDVCEILEGQVEPPLQVAFPWFDYALECGGGEEEEEPEDVCQNVDGVQTEGPCADEECEEGSTWNNESQTCVTDEEEEEEDVCTNVDGVQTEGPCADETCESEGGTWNAEEQDCVTPAEQCEIDGGSWNGQSCDFPSPPSPTDVCENLEGVQSELPNDKVFDGSGNCVSPGGGGGTGGGGGGTMPFGSGPTAPGWQNNGVGGDVLGASIDEEGNEEIGEVLGDTCEPLLNGYLRMGWDNDPEEVKKLQNFLNENLGIDLPVTGFFGPMTFKAVSDFQVKYGPQILVPWIEHGHPNGYTPTGYVYKTTMRWINMLNCPALDLEIPQLP